MSILAPIPNSFELFAANGQYIEWGPLIDGLTDGNPTPTYVNNATGTLSVKDPAGVVVPACGFPISFAYVAASTGIYRALIPAAFNPPPGGQFLVIVDLTAAGFQAAHWEVPAFVRARKS
jgi:hypothetical protein